MERDRAARHRKRTAYAAAPLAACVAAVACAVGGAFLLAPPAFAQEGGPRAGPAAGAAGKKIYQEANCVGCHRWHGGGGGGYGGAALSLRSTALTREQIVEVVRCGRPNTGMPYFERDAYAADGCYGLTKQDLGDAVPGAGVRFLRPREIETVADYVVAEIKGKGDPDHADCTAYFGEGSRVCQQYQRPGSGEAGGRPPGER
ncbi:hypothetical protein GCM10009416_09000 [Craurococcus roseus]|uniref:Cytochrome c domain-containing protein n=1 Tax=Craurococcus roseus TaxID=77585 RepID=A0ABP3PVV1_9PROT